MYYVVNKTHKPILGYVVEKFLQVNVYYPNISIIEVFKQFCYCLFIKELNDCSADFLIRALSLDLLPDEEGGIISKKKAAERLNEIVREPSFDVFSLGPLALSKVTHVLMDAGYSETAFDLLFTLSEKEGPYPPEYLTAIGAFIVKHILGISFSGGKVQKDPKEKGRLKNVSGRFMTPDGEDIVI